MRTALICLWAVLYCFGCGSNTPEPTAPQATPPAVAPASAEALTAPVQLPWTQATPLPPEPVFRPSDNRPQHDVARARELGIERYASTHLELFTDIDPQLAQALPPLVDALYEELTAYFGPLAPNREGAEYQMTGYLISEADRFRAAGMLPEELPLFEHGRHRGLEFWLFDQKTEYFRSHLVLHEATHCFMTTMPGPLPPTWYMEGMAEHFATHIQTDRQIQFGVLPPTPEAFQGWGGLNFIEQELREDRSLRIAQVMQLGQTEFAQSKTIPYAWSWWLCAFLARHPDYQDQFRELGQHLSSATFESKLSELFPSDNWQLEQEWTLATRALRPGLDLSHTQLKFPPLVPITPGESHTVTVVANGGWQAAAVRVYVGQTWKVTAAGRTTLASSPRPWESTADGITIRYAEGQPIGRLLGVILPEVEAELKSPVQVDLGASSELVVPVTGLLYLRVNDHWNELSDNTGALNVTLQLQN